MGITASEAREEMVEDLSVAVERIDLAMASLGEAYEQVSVTAQDRLEAELFRPVQRSLGKVKRARAGFAERYGILPRELEVLPPGPPSRGPRGFVEGAVAAVDSADRRLGELQDSSNAIEFGDRELRAVLAEARAALADVPGAAQRFLSTLGR